MLADLLRRHPVLRRAWCLSLLIMLAVPACAQNKNSKAEDDDTEKVVRFNYVVDDPMDAFGPGKNAPAAFSYYTVPEFYFPGERKVRDTTFRFLCYDLRDTLIPQVADYDLVRYYSLFKEYNDPVHTYNDNGVRRPLPISSIVKRYDQIAPAKWMSIEYPGNKYTELKGDKSNIIKTDTVVNAGLYSIYRYYKVRKN